MKYKQAGWNIQFLWRKGVFSLVSDKSAVLSYLVLQG